MKVQFNDYGPINRERERKNELVRERERKRETDRQTEEETLNAAEKSVSSGMALLNGAKRTEDSLVENLLLAYERYSAMRGIIQTSIKRHRLSGSDDNRTAAANTDGISCQNVNSVS